MAFYLLGDCIREQRERLGVTQEELCEGICSVPTLSKIENGRQGMRLNQYIAIMERLGLPVEPLGVRVTNDEMYWYNIKREIRHRLASQKEDVEELLDELKNCPIGMDNMTEQYITFVRAGLRREKAGFDDEMLELLLHAIHCTYRNFDINQVNSVKLLTTDEILIINCIDTGFKGLYTLINTINMSDFLIFKSECQAGKGVFMFKYNKDVIPTDCEPGVTRKILCYSDDLMMCEITFKKGSKGNFHKHEHLQITYIAKGSFEFTIGGETKIVNQGDSVYMPSNVEHGVTALEDGILVDVFNPMRKDFLA